MKDIIRDSTLGQVLRFVMRNEVLQYPEEASEFTIPEYYLREHSIEKPSNSEPSSNEFSSADIGSADREETLNISLSSRSQNIDVERAAADPDLLTARTQTEMWAEQLQVDRTVSRPIIPVRTADGDILVNWYSTGICVLFKQLRSYNHIDTFIDDPANPQNWSWTKKNFVAFLVW